MNLKKNFVLLMTVIIGGLAFTACNDDDDDNTYYPQSFVQLVNAYSHADDGLGFKFNQQSVNPNQPLDYGDNFTYLGPITPGAYNLSVGVSGTETSILDTNITLKDSTYHTAIIYGSESFPASITVEDKQPSDFDQSKANVRFFNLAENTVPLNVNLIGSGEPMEAFTNRDLDDQTSAKQNQIFKQLTTGVYTIQLTDASGAELATTEETVDITAGGYYTIIAQGVKDDSEKPLEIQFVDHFPKQ